MGVVVDGAQKAALRGPEAGVHRSAKPPIDAVLDDLYGSEARPNQTGGLVFRSIVDNNQLGPRRTAILCQMLERFGDEVNGVPRRNHDREPNGRLEHVHPPPMKAVALQRPIGGQTA